MAYRTALRPAPRARTLRFRHASAYVFPAFLVVAAVGIAHQALDHAPFSSIVTCAQGACLLLRADGGMEDKRIECSAVDALILELVTPATFVHHEVYLHDAAHGHAEVSADQARDRMAQCVSGSAPLAVTYVRDTRSRSSFVSFVVGLCVAVAAARYLRVRGLTLGIDEITRELKVRDQGLLGGPSSCSVPLGEVAELAVFEVFDHETPRIGETSCPGLFVLKADGGRVEIARGRSMFDRARYKRAAARAMALLDPSAR